MNPHPAIRRAIRDLQRENVRALTAGEGRGNSSERMAQILDEALGYSELVESLNALMPFMWEAHLATEPPESEFEGAVIRARAALTKANPEKP